MKVPRSPDRPNYSASAAKGESPPKKSGSKTAVHADNLPLPPPTAKTDSAATWLSHKSPKQQQVVAFTAAQPPPTSSSSSSPQAARHAPAVQMRSPKMPAGGATRGQGNNEKQEPIAPPPSVPVRAQSAGRAGRKLSNYPQVDLVLLFLLLY